MPKNSYQYIYDQEAKKNRLDNIQKVRLFKAQLDEIKPNIKSTPMMASGGVNKALAQMNQQIYDIYSSMPDAGDEESIAYRYAVDSVIANAFGVDVSRAAANHDTYMKYIFNDSKIDNKGIFKAWWDSAVSYGKTSDVATLNRKWLNADNDQERAEIDAQIAEKKRELVRLGDYNMNRTALGEVFVSSAPLQVQIGKTALFTMVGAGIGGALAAGSMTAANAINFASKLNVLNKVVKGATVVEKGVNTGKFVGLLADGIFNTFNVERGLSIDRLRSMEDPDGGKLSDDVIFWSSLLSASVSTLIEYATPDMFAGSLTGGGGLLGDFINRASIKTVKESIANGIVGSFKKAIPESIEEGLQAMSSSLIDNISLYINDNLNNTKFDPTVRDTIASTLTDGFDSFLSTIGPMILTGGLFSAAMGGIKLVTSGSTKKFISNNFESGDGTSYDINTDSMPESPVTVVSPEYIAKKMYKVAEAETSTKKNTNQNVQDRTQESQNTQTTQSSQTPVNAAQIVESSSQNNFYDQIMDDIISNNPADTNINTDVTNLQTEESNLDADEIIIETRELDSSKPVFNVNGERMQFKDKIPNIKMTAVTGDAFGFYDIESAETARILDRNGVKGARVDIVEAQSNSASATINEYNEIADIDETNKIIKTKTFSDASSIISMLRDDNILPKEGGVALTSDGDYVFTVRENGQTNTWTVRSEEILNAESRSAQRIIGTFSEEDRKLASDYISESLGFDVDSNEQSSDISTEAIKPSTDALLLYSKATGIPVSDIVNNKQITFNILTDSEYKYKVKKNHGKQFRGEAVKTENGITINLTKNADPTTIIHEIGHAIRLTLPAEQLEAFTNWYGSGAGQTWTDDIYRRADGTYVVSGEVFTNKRDAERRARKNEERFANDFVKYVVTNEAPTYELVPVFERIKNFLMSILDSFKNDLDPELKKKFDDLFIGSEIDSTSRKARIDFADSLGPAFKQNIDDDESGDATQIQAENGTKDASKNVSERILHNAGKLLTYDEVVTLVDGGYYVSTNTINYLLNKKDSDLTTEQKKRLYQILNDKIAIRQDDLVNIARQSSSLQQMTENVARVFNQAGIEFDESNPRIARRIAMAWNWAHSPSPMQLKQQFISRFANKDGILTLKKMFIGYMAGYRNKDGQIVYSRRSISSPHIRELLKDVNRDTPENEINIIVEDIKMNTRLWQRAFNTVYESTAPEREINSNTRDMRKLYMQYATSFNSDYFWEADGIAFSSWRDVATYKNNATELDEDTSIRGKVYQLMEMINDPDSSINNLSEEEFRLSDSMNESEIISRMEAQFEDRAKSIKAEYDRRISQLDKKVEGYKDRIKEIRAEYNNRIKELRDQKNRKIKAVRTLYQTKILKKEIETKFSKVFSSYSRDTHDGRFIPLIQFVSFLHGGDMSLMEVLGVQDNPDSVTDYSIMTPDGKGIFIQSSEDIINQRNLNEFIDVVNRLIISGEIDSDVGRELIRRIQSDAPVELDHSYLVDDLTGKAFRDEDGKALKQTAPESDYITWPVELRYALLRATQRIMRDARDAMNMRKMAERVKNDSLITSMMKNVASDYQTARDKAKNAVIDRLYDEKVEDSYRDKENPPSRIEFIAQLMEDGDNLEQMVNRELSRNPMAYFSQDRPGELGKIMKTVSIVNTNIIKPQSLARMLDGMVNELNGTGYDGAFYNYLVRDAWKANQEEVFNRNKRIDNFISSFKEIMGYDLPDAKHKDHLGRSVELHRASNGTVIKGMTALNALEIYLHARNGVNSQGAQILMTPSANNISEADIARILDPTDTILSKEERQLGDWMIQELASNFGRVAEVAYRVQNKVMPKLKNYWPRRPSDFTSNEVKDPEKSNTKPELSQIWDGVTDLRKGDAYELNLDPLSSFISIVTAEEHYIAFIGWAKTGQSILNDNNKSGIRGIIRSYAGESYDKALVSYYNRIVNGPDKVEDYFRLANKVLSNINASRIALSIPSMLRQFIGLATSKMMIGDEMSLGSAFWMVCRNYDMVGDFINERDAMMLNRARNLSLERFTDDPRFKALGTRQQKLVQKCLMFTQFFDNIVARTVWLSVYKDAIENKKVSEEEAIFRASQAVSTTQSTNDILSMSKAQTSGNTFIRNILSFTNDLFQMWNNVYYYAPRELKIAMKQLSSGNTENARKHFGKFFGRIFAPIVASALGVTITMGFLKAGDDDKEIEFDLEKFLRGMFGELASNYIPLLGLILQDSSSGYSGQNAIMKYINDIIDLVPFDLKTFEFKGKEWIKDIDDVVFNVMEITGAPGSAAKRASKIFYDFDNLEFDLNVGHAYNSNVGNLVDNLSN